MRNLDALLQLFAFTPRNGLRVALAAVAMMGFALVSSNVAAGEAPAEHGLVRPAGDHQAAFFSLTMSELLGDQAGGILLPEADVERYRGIFAAQANANWAEADRLIAALSDKRLLGHVLYQRYMRPNGFQPTYEDLKTWLARYADLPGAERLHAMATRHKPAGDRLVQPTASRGLQGGLAAAATMSSGNYAAWRAGLSAWQQRDYAVALSNFEQLARDEEASPWDQAAGAFWAARSLTRLGRPADVTPWLIRASHHSRTFYGLLANRQLGTENTLNWTIPDLAASHLKAINNITSGHRALGLLQIGQMDLAEDELRQLHPRGNDHLEEALVALASAARLPNLALRIGTSVPSASGALYDAALYPMPRWQPEGGFQIDRAFIFALVRQESRFDPEARSHVGATGLMQLMPATASFVAGRKFDRNNLGDLMDPEINLTLGQRYVTHLLSQPDVDNNLFYLLAAYNSGPTQVARWRRDMGITNDPLLFLEMLPADETRAFTERVLANFWIYQLQMNQPTPTLDAVASGDWPLYQPADEQVVRVADNQTVN